MRVPALLLVLTLASQSALAQSVLGSVVKADSTTPVAGAIVTATSATGASLGRALTNARGEFALRLSAPGKATLTVLRIGFRPASGPTLTLDASATERVRIVVSSAAVTLRTMSVKEPESCRVSADTGLAVARVWEEARKAMLTSQLTSDAAPLFAEWIEYERTLDSLSRVVRRQRVRTTRSLTTHAFKSVPADVLRDQGFVVEEAGNSVFYAPDAEALLSDEFVSGHCFHLVDPPRGAGQLIGVAFAPKRDRSTMREIDGTLWVDRATAELRTLDFHYINLPSEAESARPGGTVEFVRLSDGNWIIVRWNVRMPVLAASTKLENRLDRSVYTRRILALRAVQVTGGEVTRALRGDSVVHRGTGPSVRVQVASRDSLMSTRGATLTLDGTDYSATADDAGRLAISPVLAGRYTAQVRTPQMELLGMPAVEREVETRDDVRPDTVMLPSARATLATVCKDSIQGGEGLLHGRVLDQFSRGVPDLAVTVSWSAGFNMISTGGSDKLSYSERTLQARTDAAGRFKLCGVPTDQLLVASVASGALFDRQRVRLNDGPFAAVDLVLHERVAESREIEALNRPRDAALIEFIVTNERNEPLAGAALEVYPASGPVRTVATGSTGVALVPDVRYGRLSLRARKVGLTPGTLNLMVDSARLTVPIIMGSVRAPMLDTVRVVGARALSPRLDDFERRLALKQATASFTADDIRKRNPVDAWQMVVGLSSINIGIRDYKVVATSRRSLVDGLSDKPCFTRVMVDGLLLPADQDGATDLRQLPSTPDIHGIEYFDGPSSIPTQYSSSAPGLRCGLIAVWTK